MENQSRKSPQAQSNEEQDRLIQELQQKYGVDTQEVLNAIIDSGNDRNRAEEYLRERTRKPAKD